MSICKEWHVPTSWSREKNHQHQLQQHKIQCKCQRPLYTAPKGDILDLVWFLNTISSCIASIQLKCTLLTKHPQILGPEIQTHLDTNKSDLNYLRTLGTSLWVWSCILKVWVRFTLTGAAFTHIKEHCPLTARRASPLGHDQLICILPFINNGASENIRGDETQPDYYIPHTASSMCAQNTAEKGTVWLSPVRPPLSNGNM